MEAWHNLSYMLWTVSSSLSAVENGNTFVLVLVLVLDSVPVHVLMNYEDF